MRKRDSKTHLISSKNHPSSLWMIIFVLSAVIAGGGVVACVLLWWWSLTSTSTSSSKTNTHTLAFRLPSVSSSPGVPSCQSLSSSSQMKDHDKEIAELKTQLRSLQEQVNSTPPPSTCRNIHPHPLLLPHVPSAQTVIPSPYPPPAPSPALRIAIDHNATGGLPGTFPQLGYLTPSSSSSSSSSSGGDGQGGGGGGAGPLPLYGQKSATRRERWMYYTVISPQGIKVPIYEASEKNRRNCMSEVGCGELWDGDHVSIPDVRGGGGEGRSGGGGDTWKVNMYERDLA